MRHAARLFGAAALTLAFATAPQAAEWRGWNIHPEDYPVSIGMEAFAEEVAEKTGGEITMKVYHNGVLGNQPDAIEQVRLGAIDWAVFNAGPLGTVAPEVNVLSLPFIFKTVDAMHEVMDGPVGEEINDGLRKVGLEPLGWFDSGARSFYHTSKLIKTPEDMQGQKVRVMGNDLYIGMIGNLGGNATPLPYADVFQSLQTGVIDAAENNYPSFESSGHFEVAKFYSNSEHLILPECLCINKSLFDGLTEEQQAILREAGKNATALQRQSWAEREKASKEKVLASGVEIYEIEDKAPFQAAMQPVYASFLEDYPDLEGLVQRIQDAQK
jgi:tripartite ATP-independent transporter DctP family solute receptor